MSIETQDPQTVGANSMGILGHVAISALHGAVRGLQARQAERAAAPPPPPNPVVKPAAPRPAPVKKAEPRLPMDRYALARARIYHFSVEALKTAHALAHPNEDPAAAQKAQIEAAWLQRVARKLSEMGLKNLGNVQAFREAQERDLGTKLARSQVLLIASPSGGVDVYGVEPELQRSVAQVLEPSDYETQPASSGRVWGAPPKSKTKSRKEK